MPVQGEPEEYLAYVYDGSLEGMLSAIFAAYEQRENPDDVVRSGVLQPRLGQNVRVVPTDIRRAERVRDGIVRTCGGGAYAAVRAAALIDEPRAATHAYRFVRYAMGEGRKYCRGCSRWSGNGAVSQNGYAAGGGGSAADGGSNGGTGCGSNVPALSSRGCGGTCTRGIMADIAQPEVAPLAAYARAVANECENMRQFVRFNRMANGVWFSRINPKADVVPLIMDWFAARLNTQRFIIYDEVHGTTGVYDGMRWHLVRTDEISLPPVAEGDAVMQEAWKRFYDTVAIDCRYNPELRVQHMPKRFWRNLPEVREQGVREQGTEECSRIVCEPVNDGEQGSLFTHRLRTRPLPFPPRHPQI